MFPARRFGYGRGFPRAVARGQERLDQGLSEIKHAGEILTLVGVLFAEDLFLDEEKHHVAHMLALGDPPFAHDSGGHRPELLQRQIAKSDQQFRPGDVARLTAIALGHPLEREIQRILEEKIRMGIITPVPFEDGNHGLLELHGLHADNLARHMRRVKVDPTLAGARLVKHSESYASWCGAGREAEECDEANA